MMNFKRNKPKPGKTDNHDFGTLTYQEWLKRRSPSLRPGKTVKLNALKEIGLYFQRQDNSHVKKVASLAKSQKPLSPDCRMIIMIPAFNEENNIGTTLRQFADLDIDTKNYEIILVDNRPAGVLPDKTEEVVAQFESQHPQVNLVYIQKQWSEDEFATVGNARKWAADVAMMRILESLTSDQADKMILVTSDADLIGKSSNYASAILDTFDCNPQIDSLFVSFRLPKDVLFKPTILASVLLWDAVDEAVRTDAAQPAEDRIPEPVSLLGAASAFRLATYVAVGGYNPAAINCEDAELGWMIHSIRDWHPESIICLDKANVFFDPRRIVDAVVGQVPLCYVHADFDTDKERIASLDYQDLLKLVPNSLDWDYLQKNISGFWDSGAKIASLRFGWNYKYVQTFQWAMDSLGLVCVLKDDQMVLQSIDGLLEGPLFKDVYPDQKIEVVRSDRPVLFSGLNPIAKAKYKSITKGVREARTAYAHQLLKLSDQAKKQQKHSQADRLYKRYLHFLHRDISSD